MKETSLRRALTVLGDIAPAQTIDPSMRITRVGNLIAGIHLYPKGGRLLSTVQGTIVEFRASLTIDGIVIPLEAELEDVYFSGNDQIEDWESIFSRRPFIGS